MPPEQTNNLLIELATRMDNANIRGFIRVVGGAAIAFSHPQRRMTVDIDALVLPIGSADAIIEEMAREFGLADNWINDAAKGFIPLVGLGDWLEVELIGNVSISIASNEMLLAMKLYANRSTRDLEDIEFLLEACNITGVEHAQEIYERYHAQDVIKASAVARIEHWLESRDETIAISTDPEAMAEIAEAREAIAQGNTVDLSEVKRRPLH